MRQFADRTHHNASSQTLLKISNNIIEDPRAPQKRTMKASNKALKTNVLDIKGGQDYLVAVRGAPLLLASFES